MNTLISALRNVTTTENGDTTLKSSGGACVDFFFAVKEKVGKAAVLEAIEKAWNESAADALALIFYTMDVREGKSCNAESLYALHWVLLHHPETFFANLRYIETFGCVRDLATYLFSLKQTDETAAKLQELKMAKKHGGPPLISELGKSLCKQPPTIDEKLYDRVKSAIVDLFVDALQKDKSKLVQDGSGEAGLSLYAKWLPTQGSELDRATNLFDAVAVALFQKDHPGQTSQAMRRVTLIQARTYLRKTYITPLRAALRITERLMSDKQWAAIDYAKVPSKCMHRNRSVFGKRDTERFTAYITDVSKGEQKINTGTLKPHEIVSRVGVSTELDGQVAEVQWSSYVNALKERGQLSNAVAVCDVSGSMYGEPMEVCVALGILTAQVTNAPWQNNVITFSANPQFHTLPDGSLYDKVQSLRDMDFGLNTDFDAVFNLILERAKANKVPDTDMVRTIFVFSDMQFDEAAGRRKTAFERIKQSFSDAGYTMPHIVFWNLRSCGNVPVKKDENGTALVSGFSGNLLKLFLEGNVEDMTPESVMHEAIGKDRYNVLKVVD